MPPTISTSTTAAPQSSLRIVPAQILRGALMGIVDLVPGVSGGTVALVLGIYRQLINALHTGVAVIVRLLRGDLRGAWWALKYVPWLWVGGLGLGMLAVISTAAGPIKMALENYPMQLAGLFCGLVTASVILCWRQLDESSSRHYQVAAATAVLTFIGLGLSPVAGTGSTVTAPLWAFFVGGAIAITAMILPGISGSFLLLLMGLYTQVLGAVADRNVAVILVFALGCATGLALSASTLRWLLYRYHDLVLAAMIGLMVGSIRILWPWPGGLDAVELGLPTASNWLVPLALAGIGLVVVLALDAIATRLRTADTTHAATDEAALIAADANEHVAPDAEVAVEHAAVDAEHVAIDAAKAPARG